MIIGLLGIISLVGLVAGVYEVGTLRLLVKPDAGPVGVGGFLRGIWERCPYS